MQQNQTQTTPLNIHLASGLVRKKKLEINNCNEKL